MSFNYTLNGDELTVEEGTTAIPEFAFRQNNLFLTVVLPTTLETIGRFAFDETSLTEVSLPDSLITIEQGAFRQSDLTELVVPDSVVSIGASAFDNTDLAAVRLPESLTSIGDYAFYNTPLTQVIIPESVQTLGRGAFAATNIESVVVPASFAGNLPTNAFNPGTEITLSGEPVVTPEPTPAPAPVVENVVPEAVITPEPTPAPAPVVENVVPEAVITPEPTPAPAPVVENVVPEPVVTPEPTPAPVIEDVVPALPQQPSTEPNAAGPSIPDSSSVNTSKSAPSIRNAFAGLGAVNKVVDSIQSVVDKVIQVGDAVRLSSTNAEIIIPQKFSELVSVDHSLANKMALNANSFVKNLDVEMQVPGLQLDAKKMAKSDFIFASGLNAEFVSDVRKMKKVSVSTFKGDDVVRFVDGLIKKSSVSTGQGDDLIALGEDVIVSKKTKFRLGKGGDQVDIQGVIRNLKIDLGDDESVDVVSLAAEDLVTKRLKISNFKDGDQLIIDGDVFTYSDLRDDDFDRIKIGFGGSSKSSAGVSEMIDSLGVNALSELL